MVRHADLAQPPSSRPVLTTPEAHRGASPLGGLQPVTSIGSLEPSGPTPLSPANAQPEPGLPGSRRMRVSGIQRP